MRCTIETPEGPRVFRDEIDSIVWTDDGELHITYYEGAREPQIYDYGTLTRLHQSDAGMLDVIITLDTGIELNPMAIIRGATAREMHAHANNLPEFDPGDTAPTDLLGLQLETPITKYAMNEPWAHDGIVDEGALVYLSIDAEIREIELE